MEIKRGILRDFDSVTYEASVQLAGSLSAWLIGVPVARNIAPAEMVSGRQVAILIFGASNPKDAVISAVWS